MRVFVHDVLNKEVSKREAADHGVISFETPSSINDLVEQVSSRRENAAQHHNTWSLSKDDEANPRRDDALMSDGADKLLSTDSLGDRRIPYMFCFQHDSSSSRRLFPRLKHAEHSRRRVIFTVAFGANAKGQQYYDELAKEKHLSSTEELFQVVDDRVNEIVRLIDEMRQREYRMKYVTETTTQTVSMYSLLACITITIGAMYTSYWTLQFIAVKTKRRLR